MFALMKRRSWNPACEFETAALGGYRAPDSAVFGFGCFTVSLSHVWLFFNFFFCSNLFFRLGVELFSWSGCHIASALAACLPAGRSRGALAEFLQKLGALRGSLSDRRGSFLMARATDRIPTTRHPIFIRLTNNWDALSPDRLTQTLSVPVGMDGCWVFSSGFIIRFCNFFKYILTLGNPS